MPYATAGESRIAGLGIVPLALLVHNAEEALMIGTELPRIADHTSRVVGRSLAFPSAGQYYVALVVVTVLGFALFAAARAWPPAAYPLVVLQAVMTLNVMTHTLGAVMLGGYVPGLVTAWLVEAPTSWVVFRRVQRARWMSAWQWLWLAPLAILVHGPLLLGFLMLIRSLD